MLQISNAFGKRFVSGWLTLMALLPFGSAQANSTETVLYAFTGGKDGGDPQGGLVRDSAGNLWGTTVEGGTHGAGTVFKITKAGKEKVLYSFSGGNDGGGPFAGLLKHSTAFYGTTSYGGADGYGTVFEVTRHGTEFVVHSLAGTDGQGPVASLVKDDAGNLYGTANGGGAPGLGTIFGLTPEGTEDFLHVFTGGSDGANPRAGLVLDRVGNLYGTTAAGGTDGTGTVFKIAADGTESVLYSFTDGGDGGHPFAGLIEYRGEFYGTTYDGGADYFGTVFEVTPTGTETVLHSFSNNSSDGIFPEAGLIRDKSGGLYGTTASGGADGEGTVFKITPAATETVVYSFAGGRDGAGPEAGLIMDSAENLYGTTTVGGNGYGTVFEIHR